MDVVTLQVLSLIVIATCSLVVAICKVIDLKGK